MPKSTKGTVEDWFAMAVDGKMPMHCRSGDFRDGRITVHFRDEGYGFLGISAIENSLRPKNCTYREKHIKTGMFAPFMDKVETLAKEAGFRAIFFDSVVNEFLPDVLVRRGYIEYTPSGMLMPRYWLMLDDGQSSFDFGETRENQAAV